MNTYTQEKLDELKRARQALQAGLIDAEDFDYRWQDAVRTIARIEHITWNDARLLVEQHR